MKKRYYIAYGSNLNIRQMRMRCPSARIIGTSEIPDYELLFKGSRTGSYLTIEPKKGSRVPVAAWEVNAEDEQALDRYEGFPTFYYKAEIFVYIMHENRPYGVPSRFYMATCLEGYRSFGFDETYLLDAIKTSRRMSHERK